LERHLAQLNKKTNRPKRRWKVKSINRRAEVGLVEPSNYNLTHREMQVVSLLVQGLSNLQIADRLGLKFYTVTTHLKSIYKKLGVHKRILVASKVLTEGITTGSIRTGFAINLQDSLDNLPAPATEVGLLFETTTPPR